jgi:hypothetical protein
MYIGMPGAAVLLISVIGPLGKRTADIHKINNGAFADDRFKTFYGWAPIDKYFAII